MTPVVKTVNLTKRYGTLVALSNLNLEINEGDCFGFIGPNGAGKTTTIKVLATLLQPTWGEARICDYVVGHVPDKRADLAGLVADDGIAAERLPPGGLKKGCQHLDGSGLARAVGADEAETITRHDL